MEILDVMHRVGDVVRDVHHRGFERLLQRQDAMHGAAGGAQVFGVQEIGGVLADAQFAVDPAQTRGQDRTLLTR